MKTFKVGDRVRYYGQDYGNHFWLADGTVTAGAGEDGYFVDFDNRADDEPELSCRPEDLGQEGVSQC